MQEDKEPVFDAESSLSLSLAAMTGMIADLTAYPEAMRAALEKGHPTATDLADYLVRVLNMPFRDAHHVTGKLVALADQQGCALDGLSLADMQAIEPRLEATIFGVLSIDSALQARDSFGGTAPAEVSAHIKAARAAFLKNT